MPQEIGETRQEMRRRLLGDKIYEVSKEAHEEKGLDEFWIIFSHREDAFLWNVIRESIVVTSKKPKQRLLSSMCFHVVWSRGLVEAEWILPRDLPIDEGVFGSDGHSEFIFNTVASMGAGILAN